MKIDFRSDTVTKPGAEMLEAMMQAKVGDDVFGEDPAVNELERKAAALFGMEHAVYCPSGTMTNQIALNILSQPYEEVICYSGAHIYKYEGGGGAGNSGLSFKLIEGDNGILSAEEIEQNINPDDVHYPRTSIIGLENTVNKGGGCYYTLERIKEIKQIADKHGLYLHLDGARLFNALAETGESPLEYGRIFDTISICLSKGLGAPVGSLLLSNKELGKKARRIRKVFGGGMRQAGFLATAGIYALDHHRERLVEDHKKAKRLAGVLEKLPFVEKVIPVYTNIVIFKLSNGKRSADFVELMKSRGIGSVSFGPHEVRFVTHLDITDSMMDEAIEILQSIKF